MPVSELGFEHGELRSAYPRACVQAQNLSKVQADCEERLRGREVELLEVPASCILLLFASVLSPSRFLVFASSLSPSLHPPHLATLHRDLCSRCRAVFVSIASILVCECVASHMATPAPALARASDPSLGSETATVGPERPGGFLGPAPYSPFESAMRLDLPLFQRRAVCLCLKICSCRVIGDLQLERRHTAVSA